MPPRLANAGPHLTLAQALCIAVAAFAGCSSGEDQAALFASFANADRARLSPSEELRRAIENIAAAGGLPNQLARPTDSDPQNAANALADIFNGPLRTALNAPLERLMDRDRLRFDEDDLWTIDELFKRHTQRIKRVREASELPTARFPIAPQFGFFTTPSYLDDAAIACRFDLVEAGVQLSTRSVPGATAALRRAARWIGWLADEPRLEPRLLAARLRGEWLLVVEAIAEHPSTSLADYEQLRAVLVEWLARWPSDIAPLVGDRAATIHAYEAIRAGRIDPIATDDELARLRSRGVTADLPRSAAEIDADELTYLRVWGQLAAGLETPYFERAEDLKTVRKLLGKNRDAPFAEEMFLTVYPAALRKLAIDRAACEAWAIALSAAGGFRMPELQTNPHSGADYQIDRLPRSLVVRTGDAAIRDAFAMVRVP